MTYKTGTWGEKAKIRSKKRLNYFKKRYQQKYRTAKLAKSQKSNPSGVIGEELALKIFKGCRLVRNRGFDLKWGKCRIEVKTAIPKKNREGWNFTTVHIQKNKTDFFLFICLNEKYQPERIYLVPNREILTKTVYLKKESTIFSNRRIESEVII